jgi:hypothetical protein
VLLSIAVIVVLVLSVVLFTVSPTLTVDKNVAALCINLKDAALVVVPVVFVTAGFTFVLGFTPSSKYA